MPECVEKTAHSSNIKSIAKEVIFVPVNVEEEGRGRRIGGERCGEGSSCKSRGGGIVQDG